MAQADTESTSDTASGKSGPGAKANPREGLKAGYVFGEDQSAEIERVRFAIKAIAEIASDGGLEQENIEVGRLHLAALLELIEDRLAAIVGVESVGHVWLKPEAFRGTRQ